LGFGGEHQGSLNQASVIKIPKRILKGLLYNRSSTICKLGMKE